MIVSKFSHRIKGGALLDKDFSKPQAFHDTPVTRSGGIATIISLRFFYIYYLLYAEVLYNYIFISYSVFIVGFLDDLKINIKPLSRLIIMVLLLYFHIYIANKNFKHRYCFFNYFNDEQYVFFNICTSLFSICN